MAQLARLATILCFVAASFSELSGQAVNRGYIKGRVLAVDSGRVVGAIVTLDAVAAQAITDSAGAFTLRDIPAGSHVLTARRLGFVMDSAVTTVTPGDTTAVVLRLTPAPHVLREVYVRGRKVMDLPRFTAAVERASRNNGAAYTADEIAIENPVETKLLLERLPGVHVNDRGIMFDRCQDSGLLPGYGSGRGGSASFGGASGPRPRVQVYVDGLRLTRDEGGQNANEILRDIKPQSIAVMEVYTGVARIPGEYLENACAVIAIWTKAY